MWAKLFLPCTVKGSAEVTFAPAGEVAGLRNATEAFIPAVARATYAANTAYAARSWQADRLRELFPEVTK